MLVWLGHICLERGADCLHIVQLMPLACPKPCRLLPHLNPDWLYLYRLTQVVLKKKLLNGCSCSISYLLRSDLWYYRSLKLIQCTWLVMLSVMSCSPRSWINVVFSTSEAQSTQCTNSWWRLRSMIGHLYFLTFYWHVQWFGKRICRVCFGKLQCY